ncbi:MAG: glycosyltransferase [Candidatus Omnitrophica bacterium]|nr:glycosyltransferase [Candidatus Omnitrophota bacterium]
MRKKIRVLHVTEVLNPYGGTPLKLLHQVLHSSADFQFSVCCVLEEGGLACQFRKAGVEVIALSRRKNYDVGQIGDIVKIIKEKNIDIVHTHFARSNTFGRIAALLTGRPSIVSEHGILRNDSMLVLFFDNLLNLWTSAHVCNSNATLKSVRKKVLLNRKNLSVIYNGIPDDFQEYLNIPKQEVKAGLSFCSSDFIVINVGGHIPLRDYGTFMEAIAKVRPAIPEIKVIQIGEGPERPVLEEQVRKLHLEDVFLLWGYVDREKTRKAIRASDVYVNSAVWEGFGIATAEAMLCELPVIGANAGALPELIDHQQNGLLFEPGNVVELADRITELHCSNEKRERLGKAARQKVLTEFNIERFVKSFEDKYRLMLKPN